MAGCSITGLHGAGFSLCSSGTRAPLQEARAPRGLGADSFLSGCKMVISGAERSRGGQQSICGWPFRDACRVERGGVRGRGTGTRRRLQKHSFCDGCGEEDRRKGGGGGRGRGRRGRDKRGHFTAERNGNQKGKRFSYFGFHFLCDNLRKLDRTQVSS